MLKRPEFIKPRALYKVDHLIFKGFAADCPPPSGTRTLAASGINPSR
jgi:hypothetical protein